MWCKCWCSFVRQHSFSEDTIIPSSTGILLEFVIGYIHSRCMIGISVFNISRTSSRHFTSSRSSSSLRVSASSRDTVASNDFNVKEKEKDRYKKIIRNNRIIMQSEKIRLAYDWCGQRSEEKRKKKIKTKFHFLFYFPPPRLSSLSTNLMNPLKWLMEFWRDSVYDIGVEAEFMNVKLQVTSKTFCTNVFISGQCNYETEACARKLNILFRSLYATTQRWMKGRRKGQIGGERKRSDCYEAL